MLVIVSQALLLILSTLGDTEVDRPFTQPSRTYVGLSRHSENTEKPQRNLAGGEGFTGVNLELRMKSK